MTRTALGATLRTRTDDGQPFRPSIVSPHEINRGADVLSPAGTPAHAPRCRTPVAHRDAGAAVHLLSEAFGTGASPSGSASGISAGDTCRHRDRPCTANGVATRRSPAGSAGGCSIASRSRSNSIAFARSSASKVEKSSSERWPEAWSNSISLIEASVRCRSSSTRVRSSAAPAAPGVRKRVAAHDRPGDHARGRHEDRDGDQDDDDGHAPAVPPERSAGARASATVTALSWSGPPRAPRRAATWRWVRGVGQTATMPPMSMISPPIQTQITSGLMKTDRRARPDVVDPDEHHVDVPKRRWSPARPRSGAAGWPGRSRSSG